jgi:hypothetical protein
MAKKTSKPTRSAPAKTARPAYEPPRLTKFDRLEKLILSGE